MTAENKVVSLHGELIEQPEPNEVSDWAVSQLVQSVAQGDIYRLIWEGSPDPRVEGPVAE